MKKYLAVPAVLVAVSLAVCGTQSTKTTTASQIPGVASVGSGLDTAAGGATAGVQNAGEAATGKRVVVVKIKTVKVPVVHTRTVTKTVTVTTPAPAVPSTPASSTPSDGGKVYRGVNDANIGTIHVPVDSTLCWTTTDPSSNFIIGNSFNDEAPIGVNAFNQISGKTLVPAGTYHDVTITAAGAWSFTLTPGNAMEN
jgi:hypothetical protein